MLSIHFHCVIVHLTTKTHIASGDQKMPPIIMGLFIYILFYSTKNLLKGYLLKEVDQFKK